VTTVTDLVHDVINYLVTQCGQNTALGAAPLSPVLIIDGPSVNREQVVTSPMRLWIGWDAESGVAEGASAVQKFAFVGTSGGYRDEDGVIICTAEAWTGDTTPGVARGQCKAIVGAVEVMLRGAPTTGPGDSSMGGLVQWSQVERLRWPQSQAADGSSAMCIFDVTYFARLAP
jgi:hypothetical protein